MKVASAIKSGVCAAKRCTVPASVQIEGQTWGHGGMIGFCDRHIVEARAQAGGAVEVIDAPKTGTAIVPVDEAAIAAETQAAIGDLEAFRSFEIETQDDLDMAAGALREVKAKYATLDALRKTITGPMRLAMQRANDLFRQPLDYYAECETVLKGKIADVHRRQEETNRAALAAAAEAAQAGDGDGTTAALSNVVHIGNAPGVSTRDVWDFEVTDADAVPRPFLCPDATAIKKHIADADGEPEAVDGIRFYQRTIVISRAS